MSRLPAKYARKSTRELAQLRDTLIEREGDDELIEYIDDELDERELEARELGEPFDARDNALELPSYAS